MTTGAVPTLGTELAALRNKFAKMVPLEAAAMMDGHIDGLRRDGSVETAKTVGDIAPVFTLPNQHGQLISTADALRTGPLVLNFYRGTWCPYCSAEMKALDRAKAEIERRGARLLLVSPEDPAQRSKQHLDSLGLDLLHDKDNAVAKQLGLAYTFPADLKDKVYLGTFHTDISKINGVDAWQLPIPARFIVDRRGTIRSAYVDPDYRFRPDPIETLAVLDSLR